MATGNSEEVDISDKEAGRSRIHAIWSISPTAPKQARGPRVVNVLALSGVIVGVAAVFCTWFEWNYTYGTWSTSLWEFLTHRWFAVDPAEVGGVLFVSATVAALFTQISGSVQVAGLAMVFKDLTDHATMGIGFYMGVLSAAIVLASMAFPVGPGFEAGPYSIRNRLAIFGRKASQPGKQSLKGRHSLRVRLERLFRANGKWVSLLVAVSVWSVTVVSYENDFFRDDPVLTQVEGGFVADGFSFDSVFFPLSKYRRLSLDDGENSVSWNFSSLELVAGMWCAVDIGYRNLGPLNISLTVVNINGDDFFGPGDQLIVLARNGTSFEEDVVYCVSLKAVMPNDVIYYDTRFSPLTVMISFVFHDGVLDSWVSYSWFSTM
ncbi:TPA: hypothetical protein HA259_05200 [Thermoplasmata archaeon]|nr:hypothetical protein [Thermoplasmata archaeon]